MDKVFPPSGKRSNCCSEKGKSCQDMYKGERLGGCLAALAGGKYFVRCWRKGSGRRAFAPSQVVFMAV